TKMTTETALPSPEEAKAHTAEDAGVGKVDKRFVVERNGKNFVLYAGLLDLATRTGLISITTSIVEIPHETNGKQAIVTAIVVIEVEGKQKVFTGIGDAAPNNVAPPMVTCLIRF